MKTEDLHIDLSRLSEGQKEFSFLLNDEYFSEIDQKEVLGGEVEAKVQLKAYPTGWEMQVALQGEVRVECDRCLDELTEPVEAAEKMIVKLGDGEDEDIVWVDAEDQMLDLSWLLFELIEINLPLVHRHQEGECNPQMEELLQAHLCTQADPEE